MAELLALDLPKHAEQIQAIGSDACNQAHIEHSIQVSILVHVLCIILSTCLHM